MWHGVHRGPPAANCTVPRVILVQMPMHNTNQRVSPQRTKYHYRAMSACIRITAMSTPPRIDCKQPRLRLGTPPLITLHRTHVQCSCSLSSQPTPLGRPLSFRRSPPRTQTLQSWAFSKTLWPPAPSPS